MIYIVLSPFGYPTALFVQCYVHLQLLRDLLAIRGYIEVQLLDELAIAKGIDSNYLIGFYIFLLEHTYYNLLNHPLIA